MKKLKTFNLAGILAILIVSFGFILKSENNQFSGPSDLVYSSSDELLYIAEMDASCIDVCNPATLKIEHSIQLDDQPHKVFITRKGKLMVLTGVENGKLLVFDRKNLKQENSISIGHSPCDIVETDEYYIVCNRFPGEITFLNKKDFSLKKMLKVGREPIAMSIIPEKNLLYVAHHLPEMASTNPVVASKITVIDARQMTVLKSFLLPNGSNGVKGIQASRDGKYLFVTHVLGRFNLPTTQLERGWMNTNALSIVDATHQKLWHTILLDDIDRGAANPCALECSADGMTLYVSHAGTHEISIIDWEKMKNVLLEEDQKGVDQDYTEKLRFIYSYRKRLDIQGNGPRSIAIAGKNLVVANYFTNNLSFVNAADLKILNLQLSVAPYSKERSGEAHFNDANLCFQNWQSCVSCHPDARVDALNWDLLNDGMGNPKNTKSMVLSHQTPPVMSLGVRSHAKLAVRAGFRYIQFADVSEEYASEVDAYLESLKPVSSPTKNMTAEIEAGKAIFQSEQCGTCHPSPLFTNLKSYKLGTDSALWDTPALVELWRTGPYWHDGKYATLKELFVKEKHEIRKPLTDEELKMLELYLLSL